MVFCCLFSMTQKSYGQEKSNLVEAHESLKQSKIDGYVAEKLGSWVMVQNQNDTRIYLKEEVLPEGSFVAIKFENNSAKEISFSWELNLNGKGVQKSISKVLLKSKTSEVFFDPTIMVRLEGNQSINQFSIKTF